MFNRDKPMVWLNGQGLVAISVYRYSTQHSDISAYHP